jgi:hypothetical protein
MSHRTLIAIAAIAAVAVGVLLTAAVMMRASRDEWTLTRTSGPAGTVVQDQSGAVLAELTDGSRTVTLAGPSRRFTELGLSAEVVTDRWVRLLDSPYSGNLDGPVRDWLHRALDDRSADVLAVAFQYVKGAPDVFNGGIRIAGDARYRLGADFNDYLGVKWMYGNDVDRPESSAIGALDCSGFIRLVLGYRFGVPMSLSIEPGMLPRTANEQMVGGPGQMIVADTGKPVTRFDALRPGDLVFFDATDDDGRAIDHDGIYVGVDTNGDRRFISSRDGADGPTIGDIKGPSTINGSGYWATAFRAARRP